MYSASGEAGIWVAISGVFDRVYSGPHLDLIQGYTDGALIILMSLDAARNEVRC